MVHSSGQIRWRKTKTRGQTKKEDTLKGLTKKQRLRKKKIQASNEHADALEEEAEMLDMLPERARTVCAAAAFTGLTRSELKGLKWEGTTTRPSACGGKSGTITSENRRRRHVKLASMSFRCSAKY